MSETIWSDVSRHFGIPISFTKYELSKDRLYVNSGVLTRNRSQIPLYYIRDVDVSVSLFQRIFGVGTIKVISSDSTTPVLFVKDVKDPHNVSNLIYENVERDKQEHRVGRIEATDSFIEENDYL